MVYILIHKIIFADFEFINNLRTSRLRPNFQFLLFLQLFLILTQFGCSNFESQYVQWSPRARGLYLTLASETTRTTGSAVTSNIQTRDTDSLVPFGSGSWISTADSGKISGTYQYRLADGTQGGLSGSITIPTASRLLFAHQITTDSTSLTLTLGSITVSNIAQGASNSGWTITDLGNVDAGTSTFSINTEDAWPRFSYVDGIVILPITSGQSGFQQKGWIEQDHPHVYAQGLWALAARSSTFPYSVSTSTGTGSTRSSQSGDSLIIAIDAGAGATLRIHAQKAADQGILDVTIDGVSQTSFDQYSATTNYRSYRDYSLTSGVHLVKVSVSGTRNASSSGDTVYIDAFEIRGSALTDEQRAQLMIDSLVQNINNSDGGMKIAFDASLYNQDNDSGYSLMALGLAVARWNIPEHRQAFKRTIQWFADIIQSDGLWYWGYCKQGDADCPRSYIVGASGAGCNGGYCPSVNDYYTGLTPSITAIRSIDAPQSFPAVALAIYAALFPEDKSFIHSVQSKIVSGVDALISNNYDSSNGYFYSSYQYKNGVGWTLYEAQYSAGQCDVFLGLMSVYSLTGDVKYKRYADRIKENFDNDFYDSTRNVYSVGLFGPKGGSKTLNTSDYYGFAQGWCAWVFGPGVLNRAEQALTTNKTWIQGDTYSILVPGLSSPETSQTSWLLMGLTALSLDSSVRAQLKQRFRAFQYEFHPDLIYGHGAIQFSDVLPYLYTSNAGWAFLALTGQPSPSTWWK